MDLLPSEGAIHGRQRFQTAGAFAPWVRWYRPVADRKRSLAEDIQDLWLDLLELTNASALDRRTASDPSARTLTAAWLSLFAAPRDRHAIGNIVGPLVLAEAAERRLGYKVPLCLDQPMKHLRTLLGTVGFAASEIVQATKPAGCPLVMEPELSPPNANDIFGQLKRVRLLLVDDHARMGYHDVLSALLFCSAAEHKSSPKTQISRWTGDKRDLVLKSIAQGTVLLDELRASFKTLPNWATPRVLGQASYDVLLLDLRLFPTSTVDQASTEEQEFLRSLLAFCTAAVVSWPRDDRLDAAVAAAKRRCDGGREELAALTLLPLLLSHADPSLPIIIFSSTHQQEITNAFRHRPNVIASFSKPIVTGYSMVDATASALDELERAIRVAFRLHRLRPIWEAAAELGRLMAGRDYAVVEPLLRVRIDDEPIPEVFRLTLWNRLIQVFQAEFSNLLVRGRYADALMTPSNILEAGWASWSGGHLISPDDLPTATTRYMDAVADLQFYRVLQELRNARAHFRCQPMRDDQALEPVACWAWSFFILGCLCLIYKKRVVVPGPSARDVAKIAEARRKHLIPLLKPVKRRVKVPIAQAGSRRIGLKGCRQVIGKLGHMLDNGLLLIPGQEFKIIVAYAKDCAARP